MGKKVLTWVDGKKKVRDWALSDTTTDAESPRTPADLTPLKFEWLLAYTGFGDVWDAMEEHAKANGDRKTLADLRAERKRSTYRLDTVLAVVASMRDFASQVAPNVDLSENAIRAAWKEAEAYKGIEVF